MAWRQFFRRRYWDGERAREIEEFSGMAAWGTNGFNLAPRGEAHNVEGLYVNGDFFHVLGVAPVVSRLGGAALRRRSPPLRVNSLMANL